jgi:hypothetical protein
MDSIHLRATVEQVDIEHPVIKGHVWRAYAAMDERRAIKALVKVSELA